MIVQGEKDGKLDPADSIEFYGLGLDTASTDTHVYWLIAGSQLGDRIKQLKSGSGASAGDSFPYTVQRKDRLYYFSNIPNGTRENFFGDFIYYQPTDEALTVSVSIEEVIFLDDLTVAQMEINLNGQDRSPRLGGRDFVCFIRGARRSSS